MLLVVLSVSSPGWADDTHYHDYPLGGRAVGLGGAFVALASDPSGIFYNPAGIVDSRHIRVQLSTNLYGIESTDTFFSAVGQVTDLNTVFTELNIIPSSAAFTGVLERNEEGEPKTSYGLGLFVPSFRSSNVDTVADVTPDELGCQQLSYQRSVLDRTFVGGAAMGHRLDDTWQFGAGLYFNFRSLRDREEVSCFGDNSESGGAFSTASTNLTLSAASLRIAVGLKMNLDHGLSVGFKVTSPSINMFDTAAVRVSRGAVLPREEGRFFTRELQGLSANTREGTAIRAGIAWVRSYASTLSLDVDFHAPVKYRLVEIPSRERKVRNAFTLVTDVERNPVLNLHLGGEYLFWREFSMSAGLFTNFSSAPVIPGEIGDVFERNFLPRIHAFGGSLVAGFFGEHTLTRMGVTMSYGSGTDVVSQSEGLTALGAVQDFVKVNFSQLFIFVFVGSTFRY